MSKKASILEILPAELISAIMDALADISGVISTPGEPLPTHHRRYFFAAINACSLTCRAFLPHCRKYIFKTIKLVSQVTSPPARPDRTSSFASILAKSPIIAEYVEELHFRFSTAAFHRQDARSFGLLASAIQPLKNLTYVVFLGSPTFSWEYMHQSLREQVLHLIALPSVETIKFEDIVDLQVSDLLHRPKLKTLEFIVRPLARSLISSGWDLTQPSNNSHEMGSPPVPWELEQLVIGSCTPPFIYWLLDQQQSSVTNGVTGFGFEGIKTLSMVIPDSYYAGPANALIHNTVDLQHLRLELYPTVNAGSLIPVVLCTHLDNMISFSIYATMSTLRPYPLNGITALFQHLAYRKRLQVIKLNITIYQEKYPEYRPEEWGELEQILLDGAEDEWPSLVQFDLAITLSRSLRDPAATGLSHMVLKYLPRTHFKRLSADDGKHAFNYVLEESWSP